jgi:hypothetical protein
MSLKEEQRPGNSTYKKLAVQWLNEDLRFVSSSVVSDSFVLRNRQLLVAPKRYPDRNSQRSIFVPEHSFLLPGISHAHTLLPAKKYNQNAFVFGDLCLPAELV